MLDYIQKEQYKLNRAHQILCIRLGALKDNVKMLNLRIEELPILIARCEQRLEIECDVIRTQREKLKECRENILLDCSLTFVIEAIASDIKKRQSILSEIKHNKLNYTAELNKKSELRKYYMSDIEALKYLLYLCGV